MSFSELKVKYIKVVLPIERLVHGVVETNLALVPVSARRLLHAAVYDPDAGHKVAEHKFRRNHKEYGVAGRGWMPVKDE